jgi:hypothetical protein
MKSISQCVDAVASDDECGTVDCMGITRNGRTLTRVGPVPLGRPDCK